MAKRGLLTKFLAGAGTILVWFSLVAPVLFWLMRVIEQRGFEHANFDFLMPAELFPVVLLGGGLLLWAAGRARSYRRLVVGGFGAAMVLLFAGQALAVITGLATGETEPTGWQWALVLASLALYCLAVAVMGIGGVLLLHELNQPHSTQAQAT
jgi:hypothetical protein